MAAKPGGTGFGSGSVAILKNMRLHRFIGDFDLSGREVPITDPEMEHQIRDVLRLKRADALILGDGRGGEAEATISRITSAGVTCRLSGAKRKPAALPALRLTAYVAILKRENFELVVQKLTELGVAEVVPVVSARTIKLGLRTERLLKIAREAAEQSGRSTVPAISEPLAFRAAATAARGERNFFMHLAGQPLPRGRTAKANLWIGPEGGWTEEEVGLARELGFGAFRLGELTLRAETAAIAGAALLLLS